MKVHEKLKAELNTLKTTLQAEVELYNSTSTKLAHSEQLNRTLTKERDKALAELRNAYLFINNLQVSLEQFKVGFKALANG